MILSVKFKLSIQIVLAGVGFACLTILTTYPLFWHFRDSIYGFPGDAFGSIWINWHNYLDFLANNFPSYHCGLIGAPFGRTYLPGMLDPAFYEGLALTILTNEVIAYNLMVMLGIWASAFVAYLLSRMLWQSEWAAILGGVVFGFSPSLAMSAGGQMGFTHLQWMPLYLLSLFYLKQKGNLLSAILCGIALAIVVVTNYYLGYTMIVTTTVFIACWVGYVFKPERFFFNWKPTGLFLLALLIGAVLSLPWTGPILRTIFLENASESPIASIAHRPFHSLYDHAARPWDYFLPPIDHPVLGSYSQAIYDSIKGWKLGASYRPGLTDYWFSRYGNWWGQVYLGWTPVVLAIYGLIVAFRWRKRIIKCQERFILIFFGILFAVTVWFAMPPEFPVSELVRKVWTSFPDWRLPTPSYFLYNLLPMFRRYSVFGIVTILSVSILAGFGLRELLLRTENKWKKTGGIILIFGLVFFEFLHSPRHTRFPPIPQEYKWLASQPGDIIIAEYPIYYRYSLFYQRVHHKRMLNWCTSSSFVDRWIWPNIEQVTKHRTVERLGALGVRYVLLHTADYFGPNPWDSLQFMGVSKPLSRTVKGLRLIKETPTAQIFEVYNTSAIMLVWPDPNKKAKETWFSDRVWKWQTDNQRLYIVNAGDNPIDVSISAKAPQAEGVFRVFQKKDNEDKGEITRALQWVNRRVLLADIICNPGETVIEVSFPIEVAGQKVVWSELKASVRDSLSN